MSDENTTQKLSTEGADPLTLAGVNDANAVPVTAHTTYLASYFAPSGHYSYNRDFYLSGGYTNGPLTAPRGSDVAGNNLFAYTDTSRIPGPRSIAMSSISPRELGAVTRARNWPPRACFTRLVASSLATMEAR